MTKIANDTLAVTDASGIQRKVIEGQEVPADLLDAYHQAGGETADGPSNPRPAKYVDARGNEHDLPVATKTVKVLDPNLGFERAIFAGTAVPPELVDAYNEATGGPPTPDEPATPGKYTGMLKADLEAKVDERGLDVDGTGANGNVTVDDLIGALEADDQAKAEED